MRPAGQRDQLIVLQRASLTQDDNNEDIEAWGEIGREWASVRIGDGNERRAAAQTQSSQAVTFQMLDNAVTRDLTARDRIMWRGVAWDITGPGMPVVRGELEMTATGALA